MGDTNDAADWDGARYRYLIASSPREEVCFLGVAYFGKEALDRAIDAAMAEQEAAPAAPMQPWAAQDEALLRQALEALEQIATDLPWELTGLQADTIAALRERLGRKG